MADSTPDRFVASTPPDGWADGPVHDVAEELERGRHERWAAIVLLVIGLAAVVALLVVGTPSATSRTSGAIAVIAVGAGLAIVVVQEWRARRASRALAEEHAHIRGLTHRLVAMETAAEACRQVAEAEELDDVLERALAGVRRVAAARTGAVLLRTGDELNVVAAEGTDPPARGTRIPEGDGPAWTAVRTGETVQGGRGSPWGEPSGTATLAVPMALPGQVIGAVVAERGRSQPAFTASDRRSLELLADHTALAVRAALRLERQRRATGQREHRAAPGEGEHRAAPAPARHADLASLVGIVHDVKTPLATISGYVQLLIEREERFTPTRRQAVLRDVRGEVDRLKDLVDGVLQVARLASDEHRAEQLVDLVEVVRRVQEAGRDLPHAQRLPRTVHVHAATAAIVVGDEAALRRVVENLVDDALSRELTGCPLEVAVERADGWVELTVGQPARGTGGTAEEPVAGDGAEASRSDADGTEPPPAADVDPASSSAGAAEAPLAPEALPTGLQVARILVERHGGTLELAADGGAGSRVRLPAI
jgi:K+-sensing histidine kinase KdpD